MRYRNLLLLAFILIGAAQAGAQVQKCHHPITIVVIGSSTSAGAGPSSPDSTYVNRYRKFLKDSVNANSDVINIAIGGATTYKMQPGWYTPPANRSTFTVDPNRNIDKALSYNPDGILINYPSNDAANSFTMQEQKDNFIRVMAKADSAKVPVWVTTSQPRNFTTTAKQQLLTDLRDWILATYPTMSINFYDGFEDANGDIKTQYDSGDGVHMNDAAHRELFNRVVAAKLHEKLCDTPLAVKNVSVYTVEKLHVYPNPATESIRLDLGQKSIIQCRISSIDGSIEKLIRVGNNKEVNISNLPHGIYLIQATDGERKYFTRFMKH